MPNIIRLLVEVGLDGDVSAIEASSAIDSLRDHPAVKIVKVVQRPTIDFLRQEAKTKVLARRDAALFDAITAAENGLSEAEVGQILDVKG